MTLQMDLAGAAFENDFSLNYAGYSGRMVRLDPIRQVRYAIQILESMDLLLLTQQLVTSIFILVSTLSALLAHPLSRP